MNNSGGVGRMNEKKATNQRHGTRTSARDAPPQQISTENIQQISKNPRAIRPSGGSLIHLNLNLKFKTKWINTGEPWTATADTERGARSTGRPSATSSSSTRHRRLRSPPPSPPDQSASFHSTESQHCRIKSPRWDLCKSGRKPTKIATARRRTTVCDISFSSFHFQVSKSPRWDSVGAFRPIHHATSPDNRAPTFHPNWSQSNPISPPNKKSNFSESASTGSNGKPRAVTEVPQTDDEMRSTPHDASDDTDSGAQG